MTDLVLVHCCCDQYLGLTAEEFRTALERGELPHHKLGKYVRFRFDEVLACSRFRERVK